MIDEIVILRQLPDSYVKDKGYKRRNPVLVRMKMYEIKCTICGEPKSISNHELKDRRSLAHRGCVSKRTRAREKNKLNIFDIRRIIANTAISMLRQSCRMRNKNLQVLLSVDEVVSLIFNDCTYCGATPKQKPPTYKVYKLYTNGIDRVDSNMNYEINNCVPCCRRCNLAKSDMSIKEFFNWLDRIAKFNGYEKRD